jgi:predicted RNA-binding Zn-ribbon protein involved in translation (DUF1610 family)
MSHKLAKQRRRQVAIMLRAQGRTPEGETRAERRRALAPIVNRRVIRYVCGRCGAQKVVRDRAVRVYGSKPVCPECARKLVAA